MDPSVHVAVLGAGDAGRALAATLALRDLPVTLFSRSEARLEPLRRNGLTLVRPGARDERVKLRGLTTDLSAAVSGSDVVLVATNSTAHAELAAKAAGALRPEQVVLLVPGHTGGALEFRHALIQAGGTPAAVIAEAALPFVCRSQQAASVTVLQEKRGGHLACVPARAAAETAERMGRLIPNLKPSPSVLHAGFDNMTSVIQPCLILFNAARIDRGERFAIYREGISPAVAGVMEALDAERIAIAGEYGIPAQPAAEWLAESYGAHGDTLYDRLRSTAGYEGIQSPASLDHRFLMEHVPMGSVPIAALGSLAGVPAPLINSVIDLASALLQADLREKGRNLDRLGLRGCTVEEVKRIAREGN